MQLRSGVFLLSLCGIFLAVAGPARSLHAERLRMALSAVQVEVRAGEAVKLRVDGNRGSSRRFNATPYEFFYWTDLGADVPDRFPLDEPGRQGRILGYESMQANMRPLDSDWTLWMYIKPEKDGDPPRDWVTRWKGVVDIEKKLTSSKRQVVGHFGGLQSHGVDGAEFYVTLDGRGSGFPVINRSRKDRDLKAEKRGEKRAEREATNLEREAARAAVMEARDEKRAEQVQKREDKKAVKEARRDAKREYFPIDQ